MSSGRVFDEQAKKRYCLLISRGTRPLTAANSMGFTPQTVKNHLKKDMAFRDAFEEASTQANEAVEAVLYDKAVDDGDLGAIRMWLVNRASDQWQEAKSIVQHTGPGGGPIQIVQGTVLAFREVLTDPETRVRALEMAEEILPLGPGDE